MGTNNLIHRNGSTKEKVKLEQIEKEIRHLHMLFVESQLTLRKFSDQYYSKTHVNLYKWFKTFGLSTRKNTGSKGGA